MGGNSWTKAVWVFPGVTLRDMNWQRFCPQAPPWRKAAFVE